MTKDTKYLTQMKELPPNAEEVKVDLPKTEVKRVTPAQTPQESGEIETKEAGIPKQEPIFDESEIDEQSPGKRAIFSSRDVILGVINLISLGLLIFILVQFPQKAEELKELRTEEFLSAENVQFEFDDVAKDLEKSNEIESLFLKESGLVEFVNEVEKLKGEESSVQGVSFASQLAVKDRTGNYGVPVVIDLIGNWETIDRDLQRIDTLPFLFRVASVNISPSELDQAVIEFKYGLFLYVDDQLGETR